MPALSCRCLLVVVVIAIAAGPLGGQTWTGAAAPDANWSNAGNWTGGVPVSSADAQVNFAVGTTDPNQNIANPFIQNRISFGGSFARTVTGNPLDFRNSTGGTAPAIVHDGSGSPTLANQLTLTNNLEVRGTGTGAVRLTGNPLVGTLGNGGITKFGGFDLIMDIRSVNGVVDVTDGRFIIGAPIYLRLVDKQIALGATGVFGPEGSGTVNMQNVALTGGYIAGPVPIVFSGAPSTVTGTTLFSGARTVLDQNVTFTAVTSGGSTPGRSPTSTRRRNMTG